MTVPYCEVVTHQPIPSRHPLATRTGAHALINMIAANQHWRPISAGGKTALRVAYSRALTEAVAAAADRWPLPELGDEVHPATVRALVRRGLVETATLDGESNVRLTSLAVWVCAWVLLGEQRPIQTTPTTGDQL